METKLAAEKRRDTTGGKNWSIDNSTRGARGVMVIVTGNGHSDTSSNPGRNWLR